MNISFRQLSNPVIKMIVESAALCTISLTAFKVVALVDHGAGGGGAIPNFTG